MKKLNVFLTGATGHMGLQGLKQLVKHLDQYNIKLLILPTERDRQIIAPYEKMDGITVVYGDLTNYDDVLNCVNGSDIVLHVGGMVSPAADYKPKATLKVNVSAVKNIISAIKAQPEPDKVKLVYIGTVAETGGRNAPIHWGRTGDPIKISVYDFYALSKVMAEHLVIESGLKYWVSMRQTGILYPEMLNNLDPIMFHEPLNGVFEWVTTEDSGRLLANVCDPNVSEEFWCHVYNIGGGEKYRTVNWEFMNMCFGALGMSTVDKIFEPCWFATRNFHGQWYADSDKLNDFLHFRTGNVQDFVKLMKEKAPASTKMARFVPSYIIKNFVFKPVANKPFGTLFWMKNNVEGRIHAFFGSKEAWEQIPGWDKFKLEQPTKTVTLLDHGYDESKPENELDIEDMRQAARFRGGECLSTTMTKGDLSTKLTWCTAQGEVFEASPALILLGGHWSPKSLPLPWNYDEEARVNPFFAQVWYPHHDKVEHNVYDERILKDKSYAAT